MIRLEDGDLAEPRLSQLASQTTLSPEEFRAQFDPVIRGVAARSALAR
jgi:hypothetical protein